MIKEVIIQICNNCKNVIFCEDDLLEIGTSKWFCDNCDQEYCLNCNEPYIDDEDWFCDKCTEELEGEWKWPN